MASLSIQTYPPYILGDISQVVKSTGTLSRLVEFYKVIEDYPNREKVLSNFLVIWSQSIEESNRGMNLIQIKESINEKFKQKFSLTDFDNSTVMKIQSFYESRINEIDDKEIQNSLNRFLKDTKSVQTKPATKSSRGLNGPTLLVSYSRFNHMREDPQLQNYVIKWSDLTEVCSTRIYDTFSKYFASVKNFNTFYVPKLACLDLENKVYETTNCSKILLEKDSHAILSKNLNKILSSVLPNSDIEEIEDSRILLMEKVNGSNLLDFIRFKYLNLSSAQKKDLFTQIGRLAILDLITGNDDRFIQPEYNEETEEYFLNDGLESNLGNAMVEWSGEDQLTFYAIDNTISWELIDPESDRKVKYNEFLKKLLADDDYISKMAKSVLSTLNVATTIIGNVDNVASLKEERRRLEPFREDLEKIAFGFLYQGMEQMASQLNNYLSSDFNQKSELENYLYDELKQALLERFEIFKLTKAGV